MDSRTLRKKFVDFFAARGHSVVPSSSLIPDDPSVLLTTAGMQQFKKYYTGEADPARDFGSLNTVSIQKSFRTSDIDEVGDESHLTFFEMLGNFSFGGYFKEDAIGYAYDFFKEIGLPIEYATIFGGDEKIPKDNESEAIWKKLGITDIRPRGREDNFWGPTGTEGPCGPTTEIYVKGTEIWNIVFNEYYCRSDKTLIPLSHKGVDTGMGLERLAMVVQGKANIFETDLFDFMMKIFPAALPVRTKRIVADHIRAIAFLISDGVRPSNKDRGYILRRLMRRALVYEYLNHMPQEVLIKMFETTVQEYGEFYPELADAQSIIVNEFCAERDKFSVTLARGIKELESEKGIITAERGFHMYETFGIPFEIIKELGGSRAAVLGSEAFDEEFKKHQALSRAGQERKFGGHGMLLDTGELKAANEAELKIVTRLHTVTHLLQAALRKVLGPAVRQQGSDITVERTRFDFTFPRKLTPEEIRKVEDVVNEAVRRDYRVEFKEMLFDEALASGVLHFFREKYPPVVKVYRVFDSATGEVFSQELCGGPHVTHTAEIGRFRILKEESSSAGVRRIRAGVD